MKLVSGTVGHMRMQIPWKRLVWGQGSVNLEISDVMIVLSLQSREETIKENIRWFQHEIEFCKTTSRKNLLVLRYSDIVRDIPQQVKFLYQFLDQYIEKGSQFHTVLLNQKRKQYHHKKTQINPEDELISPERIERDFPNLLQEIEFSRFNAFQNEER